MAFFDTIFVQPQRITQGTFADSWQLITTLMHWWGIHTLGLVGTTHSLWWHLICAVLLNTEVVIPYSPISLEEYKMLTTLKITLGHPWLMLNIWLFRHLNVDGEGKLFLKNSYELSVLAFWHSSSLPSNFSPLSSILLPFLPPSLLSSFPLPFFFSFLQALHVACRSQVCDKSAPWSRWTKVKGSN